MKKLLNTLIGSVCLLSLLTGCSEETIPLYSGVKAGLFIQEIATTDGYGNPNSYNDSTSLSFADYPADITTMYATLHVRTMGEVVDYDRPYKIQVLETNAEEGVDFDFNSNDFLIKANESTDVLEACLHRTPRLLKETLRIKIGLVANEHFELPIEEYKNSSGWDADGPMNSAISFIISFNERYSEPIFWRNSGYIYWGKFTPTKYAELNKVTGLTSMDWLNAGIVGASKITYGRLDYFTKIFQEYLQEMADAGTPVMDEDGSYMQLAGDYTVNYSKYMN